MKSGPELRRIADNAFSKFILSRDDKCITCGKTYHLEAGHYIPRGNMATRYNFYNVHAQCIECNRFLSGNNKMYRKNLVEKYGEGLVEALEDEGRKIERWDILKYIEIILQYKEFLPKTFSKELLNEMTDMAREAGIPYGVDEEGENG